MEKRCLRICKPLKGQNLFQVSGLKGKKHPGKSGLRAYRWRWQTRDTFHEMAATHKAAPWVGVFSNKNELSVQGCSGMSLLRRHIYMLKLSFRLLPYIIQSTYWLYLFYVVHLWSWTVLNWKRLANNALSAYHLQRSYSLLNMLFLNIC